MNRNRKSVDKQLWSGLLDGDEESLSHLFRRYYRLLLNYGLKLIPSEELVKDSIQELFISVWEQRRNLSDVEHIRAYLYVSLRRTLFRQQEIQKARHRRDRSYSEVAFREVANREKLIMMNELKQEQRKQLERALNSLSDRAKEAVFLKFYSGLTNSEIAQVMDINNQSVCNHIHRALSALRTYLDGQ